MKAILKTKTSIMLLDPFTSAVVSCDRPYVAPYTLFMESRVGKGDVEVLAAELPETATDDELVACLKASDGDEELAIAAFLSIVKPGPAPESDPEPKPRARQKAKE